MSKTPTSAEMVLGTAQLSFANTQFGNNARQVLHAALRSGIRWIEATASGEPSDMRMGNTPGVRIVTRLPAIYPALPVRAARDGIVDSVHRACARLNTSMLDVVSISSVAAFSAHGGVPWRTLKDLRDEGIIFDLGVAVASPEEALIAIAEPNIRYIQLQFNALDWRWHESGVIAALSSRPDITVHAHSALLHGLLAGGPDTHANATAAIDTEELRARLWRLAVALDRDCPADLCIAYVRAQPWIDGVIAGAKNASQFALNLARFRRPALTASELELVNSVLPRLPGSVFAPSAISRAA
jgi:spore coat polysaccharide biosynthesis protein SpsF